MKKRKDVFLYAMSIRNTKYGGIERFNVELTKQLSEQGISIIFVSEEYPHVSEYVNDILAAGAEIQVISTKNPLLYCLRLARLIISRRVTLVHSHFSPANHFAIWVASLLGVKQVYMSLHGRIPHKTKMKRLTRWVHTIDCRLAKIFAVSKEIENTMKESWPRCAVKTMYLGVDKIIGDSRLSKQKLGFDVDNLIILSIGNRNHVKGFDILCDAVHELRKELRQYRAKLVIVGQEPKDKEESLETLKRFEIEDIVVLEGIKNNIPDYITSADIYVQASRTEGLPLSLMEASSFGLPLVASRIGGIPEIVHHGVNGILIEPENVSDLVLAIRTLLQDSTLRRCYAKGCEQVSSSFNLKANVAKYIEDYLG